MAVEISANFTTDLVTKRTHNKILREVNREVGEFVAARILPGKFKRTAFRKYSSVFHTRSLKYRKRKRAKHGSASPNVATGKMKRHILTPGLGHKVRATSSGGNVHIKNYFAMPKWQRREMEVLNNRDRAGMAEIAEGEYFKRVNDPDNRRKRRRK